MLTQAVGRRKQFADCIGFGERQIRKQARFDIAQPAVAPNFLGHGLTPLTPSGGLDPRTSKDTLSTTSERQMNSHRLRGGTGVGKPLAVENQRRRRILRDTACRLLDFLSLAGMQDKQKALRSRTGGLLYAEI